MLHGKWILILLLIPCWSYAQIKASTLKEIELLPGNLQKTNKIKFISEPNAVKDVYYEKGWCRPLEAKDYGNRKQKLIRYAPVDSAKKAIPYIKSLYFVDNDQKIEMEVNGFSIKATRNIPISFELIDDCKKLRPIGFVSTADQNFLGVQLKRGSVVKPMFLNENIEWGEIGSDGYPGAWKGESFEELEKLSENRDALIKRQETHLKICVQVNTPSQESVYLYKNRILSSDIVAPRYWRGNSKYIGNRICSDQPKAVIDCIGTRFQEEEFEKIIDPNAEKANELGRKCDEAVAKYEKQTGKRIRVSPFYPENKL